MTIVPHGGNYEPISGDFLFFLFFLLLSLFLELVELEETYTLSTQNCTHQSRVQTLPLSPVCYFVSFLSLMSGTHM